MQGTNLCAAILGVVSPWEVTEVRPEVERCRILVVVEDVSRIELACPECGKPCPRHDHRKRRWRHLPTRSLSRIDRLRARPGPRDH